MGFVHLSWHSLDASIASLRAYRFFLKITTKFKLEKQSFVETQCLRLTDIKPFHKSLLLKTY
jgi:hypothetical protein